MGMLSSVMDYFVQCIVHPVLVQAGGSSELAVEEADAADEGYQVWVGKDFYNPFIRDFIDLHEPFKGTMYNMYIHVCTCR